MAEDLLIIEGTKEEKYLGVLPQIQALLENETDLIANLANVCAALKEQFGWFWVGCYLVKEDELIVGPFQGPIACTRISKGRGVCGECWMKGASIIVDDVAQYRNHIACSGRSKSEIVIPIIRNDTVVAVLDIDDDCLASFDEVDKRYLEQLVEMIPVGEDIADA